MRSHNTTACYAVGVRPSGWPTLYETWDTRLTYESGRMLPQHAGWLSAAGLAPSKTWRQSSTRRSPNLAKDTECLSRASRALAAMTLVRQAAASEIALITGEEHETWIDGHRADYWTAAGWITLVIMTRCILTGLALLWWKSGRVAGTVDNGTQTLEEGSCA